MKKLVLVVLGLSLVAVFAFAADAPTTFDAKATFEKDCGVCHKAGDLGKGKTELKNVTNDIVIEAIKNGKLPTGKTHAKKLTLSDADFATLATFLADKTKK